MDELLAPVSTLDEPVSETIMRDVRAVGGKLKAVLLPLDRSVSFFYKSHVTLTFNRYQFDMLTPLCIRLSELNVRIQTVFVLNDLAVYERAHSVM